MTHEIWEGDSLDLIEKLDDNSVHCVVTDPPYGVNFRSRRAKTREGKKFVRDVANDSKLDEAIYLFQGVMEALRPKLTDPAELYVFTRWDIVGNWIEAIRVRVPDFSYKMLLIWDKGIPGMGDIDANWGCGHELILYCKKGRRDMPFRRSGIIHVDKVHTTQHIHPTEKPVALLERLIEMSTAPGDLVVDPFAGSGSSIVAARNLGRNGIGIEQDAHYVPLARERLAQQAFV